MSEKGFSVILIIVGVLLALVVGFFVLAAFISKDELEGDFVWSHMGTYFLDSAYADPDYKTWDAVYVYDTSLGNDQVVALDLKSGNEIWKKKLTTDEKGSRYSILNNYLVRSKDSRNTSSDNFELLNKKDGSLLWKRKFYREPSIVADSQNTVFVNINESETAPTELIALNTLNGAERWKVPYQQFILGTDNYEKILASETQLFVVSFGKDDSGVFKRKIVAINSETGQENWNYLGDNRAIDEPIINGEKLDFCTFFIEIETGKFVDAPRSDCDQVGLSSAEKFETESTLFTVEHSNYPVEDYANFLVATDKTTQKRKFRKQYTANLIKKDGLVFFISNGILYASK